MFKIQFNYDVKKIKLFFYKKTLEKIAQLVFKKLKLKNDIFFECIFVDLNKIQEINYLYRKKNIPTDVISFALWDYEHKSNLLGEIYICYDKILEQKNIYCHSFKRELSFLFLHGLLHLLGYDHLNEEDEKIMFSLQEEILNELGIKRKC